MRPGHRTSPRLSLQESLYCCTHDTNRILEIRRAWISPMSLSFFILFYLFIYFTLQYRIGFAIQQPESATGVHVFPILNPPPTSGSLPMPSLWAYQCTSPKLPVSYIQPGLAICFLYDIIHVSMPLSQIIPPSLSHRVQKTVLYICVSFAVSHTSPMSLIQ